MASERPLGLATPDNALLVLQSARLKLDRGIIFDYDAIDKDKQPCSSDSASAHLYSYYGAIHLAGKQAGLFFKMGSYDLLDLIDAETKKTARSFCSCFHHQNHQMILKMLDLTIKRLKAHNG